MTVGRVAGAWAPFGATLLFARSHTVSHWEEQISAQINQMPDVLHRPLWVIMQSGALGAPPAAAAVAVAAGRREAAGRLAVSGLTAYCLAKVVKHWVGRGRPTDLLPGTLVRGRPATGKGFVSGHAAVSTALALEAWHTLDGPARALPVVVAPLVGLARIYVGAHLPLDVLGGAALGWALHRTLPAGERARRRQEQVGKQPPLRGAAPVGQSRFAAATR
jgi:membrane-associated phospholipid phosphatase